MVLYWERCAIIAIAVHPESWKENLEEHDDCDMNTLNSLQRMVTLSRSSQIQICHLIRRYINAQK
jgi:hypothetical protein